MAEPSDENSDRVRDDVLCFECGYNLRSLPSQGNCPECGSPVLRSIRGDVLRYANQLWIRRLHLGLGTVWWGMVAFIGGMVLHCLLVPAVAIFYIALILWMIANACGWWLATMRDPAESQPGWPERILLRVTGILVLPVFMVWIGGDALSPGQPWPPALVEAVTLACFAVVVYHLHLVVRFMERVHRRCAPPDAKLVDLQRFVIARLRMYVKLVPSFVFGLYVLSVVVNLRGLGSPLSQWGEGIGYVLTVLLWLVVKGNLLTTLRCIRAERAAAEYQDDSADCGGVAGGEGFGSTVPHSEQAAGLPDSDRS